MACGNPPFYFTRESIGNELSWYYSTGPRAWCSDYDVDPCGFFDASAHSDEHGNVNTIACQEWVCP